MSQIQNVNGASTDSSKLTSALNQVDLDDFLKLMITELQNQDPLNPLENDQLLAQISQIREVGATEQLTATLDAVLLGQNIASATGLIGADVVALNDNNERVTGNVKSVTVNGGKPRLDLAIDTTATAATDVEDGKVASGDYLYEVVWQSAEGVNFGMEIPANTASMAGFDGAIRLNNLPQTSSEKVIYRTDRTGEGDRKFVGKLPLGATSTFIDRVADAARSGDPLTAVVQKVDFANKVTVSLDKVGEIRPPSS